MNTQRIELTLTVNGSAVDFAELVVIGKQFEASLNRTLERMVEMELVDEGATCLMVFEGPQAEEREKAEDRDIAASEFRAVLARAAA